MTTPQAALAAAIGGAAWGYDFRDADATKTGRGLAPETLRLLHDAGYALTPLAPEVVPPRRDGLRERIAALRPWPEGEAVIQSLERLADTVLPVAATRTPEPPDSGDGAALEAALERLMTAVGNYFVVSYRYAHGTGGGATDEKMDATTAAMLDAYQAVARLRSGSPAPEGGE